MDKRYNFSTLKNIGYFSAFPLWAISLFTLTCKVLKSSYEITFPQIISIAIIGTLIYGLTMALNQIELYMNDSFEIKTKTLEELQKAKLTKVINTGI